MVDDPAEAACEPSPARVSREDLAVFAHELRGALTVISGYSDMLRRPLHDAERFSALEGIRRAVHRADALCADVLAGGGHFVAASCSSHVVWPRRWPHDASPRRWERSFRPSPMLS